MNLVVIVGVGIALSIAFHFVGVYVNAKKTVWFVIALFWLGSINIAMIEVKPAAYKEIEKMQGLYPSTDALIKDALPSVSLYEMLTIKQDFLRNKKQI
ncbi:MAG: hypothetical protein FAF05_04470 [Epsilonproteobacteria bacterium]|nr:hypothetical protein [Campylobacterota bacterium]